MVIVSFRKLIFHKKGESRGPEEDENETDQRDFTTSF